MSIITISRGSYSKGKETAEKLAEKLGYTCIGRDVLIEASKHFNIPEVKLIRALYDAPSILDRFTYGKERYVSFIRRELLEWAQKDNIVYHGLAGHFFLQGIPHVLKVRINADIEDRIKEEMKREKISEEKARQVLLKDDYERRKWAIHLYGIDTADPSLYDLVLRIDCLCVDDAVDIISNAVNRPCFTTSPAAQQMIDDLVVSAQIESMLINEFPRVKCRVIDGVAHVTVFENISKKGKIESQLRDHLKSFETIKRIETHIDPII
ncbi:MAG: cytidylate kinase-like family protein [Deltaproteobacteria bacterium]|nr:cytidylate kinase-like family protein [Deltaproteobacteria bacterium]